MTTAKEIIQYLKLEILPEEGGWFSQNYLAKELISKSALPSRYTRSKPFGSAIYYLLTDEPDCFSAIHKLSTDEVFHFYLGDPIEMLLLHPNGKSQILTLGQDILKGQRVQFVVPRGVWQGCYLLPGGNFGLMGTTMAPAYDQEDFFLGNRDMLMQGFPQDIDLIHRLTRIDDTEEKYK